MSTRPLRAAPANKIEITRTEIFDYFGNNEGVVERATRVRRSLSGDDPEAFSALHSIGGRYAAGLPASFPSYCQIAHAP